MEKSILERFNNIINNKITIMRKILCILVVFVAFVFSSCSNDMTSVATSTTANNSFTQLCTSIDSLNNTYNVGPQTRSLNKWGGKVFSAVVDGITGYITGPAGPIVGTLCSWAFDAHWESCSKAMATRSSMKIPLKDSLLLTTESPTYVNANNTTLKTDSIGYYHNKILDKISMSSSQYIREDNEIDYDNLFKDSINYAKNYGINTSEATQNYAKYLALSKDIINAFSKCVQEKNDIESAYDEVNKSYIKRFENNNRIKDAEIIQKKIVTKLSTLDKKEDIKKYADQVFQLYDEANIEPQQKQDFKTITNVTVNSKLYWDNAKLQEFE